MTHTITTRRVLLSLAIALAAVGCDNPPAETPDSGIGTDGGGDTPDGGGDTPDGGGAGLSCAAYCTQIGTNCTGANAQYANEADCLAYCQASGWPEGEVGAAAGNSVQCRIYHSGAPAAADPAEHCSHAGPTGDATCGTIDFRTDAPGTYARVDRMGMPAVSTALISRAMKNAYNDANPTQDAAGTFVPELASTLTGIHTALDDDLATMSLAPCSMTNTDLGIPVVAGMLPQCFGQEIAAGVTVASLVVPDTLHIDPTATAGFPNGRMLADPVIDVTLSVILLDMGGTCGAGTCSPATLVGVNPSENDRAEGEFLPTFPYLQVPHTL